MTGENLAHGAGSVLPVDASPISPAEKLLAAIKRTPNPIVKNEIQLAAEAKRLRKQLKAQNVSRSLSPDHSGRSKGSSGIPTDESGAV